MDGSAQQGRIVALDAFRGLTIAAMILVNNPGDWSHVWAPLRHADWHGWTPTDLVFPFFLFIVGTAIPLAFARRREQGAARAALVRKACVRAAVLFGLGLFLAGWPLLDVGDGGIGLHRNLERIRVPGVLQRIAVCYLAAALLYLFATAAARRWTVVLLLVGYWALMTLVPVPGQPGGGSIDGKDTHLAAWLDRAVFGQHLWSQARTWDPEGLLSTLPALATTLLGVSAGVLLRAETPALERLARLLVRGSLLVVAGYAWGWLFPINKPIWTSSYALLTAGQAACALGLCWWAFDLHGRERLARPLVIYGQNAITVFVASGVVARSMAMIRVGTGAAAGAGAGDGAGAGAGQSLKAWLHEMLFASWLPPHAASLAWALAWVAGWYAILSAMDRRGIVIRV